MPAKKQSVKLAKDRDSVVKRIERSLIRLRDARNASKTHKEVADEIQGSLLDLFMKADAKKIEIEYEDVKITGTLVESTTLVLDEQKLKGMLGDDLWSVVTRPVLDRTLLEAAIVRGEVDAEEVAKCSSEQPRAAFIKITEKKQ
jgi:hypothetical protein